MVEPCLQLVYLFLPQHKSVIDMHNIEGIQNTVVENMLFIYNSIL